MCCVTKEFLKYLDSTVAYTPLMCSNSLFAETVFGAAPFASKSFAELEGKIRSTDPVEVRKLFQTCVLIHMLSLL